MSGTLDDFPWISEEHPYRPETREDNPFENLRPYRCARCGSNQTSSYQRLMLVSAPRGAISGDLIYRPVEVVNCLHCGSTWYHNSITLRDI